MSHTTVSPSGGASSRALDKSTPFDTRFDVDVPGGVMNVVRAGPAPADAQAVMLGLHGMTGTHMVFRSLARELCNGAQAISLLAPDLRGRGRSARLPGPYGMAAHVADLVAVLDHAGVDRAILVGHSMGCNIAARFAADHPERVTAVVLLDGGLPLLPGNLMTDAEDDDEEQPGLLDRFAERYETVEDYMAYWREHPGLKPGWDEDVEAFVRCDFVEDADGVRCIANLKCVRTDVTDIMLDGVTWTAVEQVRAPVRLMRAERGLYDDDPVIPAQELDEYCRHHPHITVDDVADVNHFTLLLGSGHGPRRVAATVAELALAGRSR